MLIIFSTKVCPISDSNDIPDRCLFIGGDDLYQYLGHNLTEQARVLVQSHEKLVNNINYASKDELILSLHRVSKKRAYLILNNRPFANWEQLIGLFREKGDKTFPKENNKRIRFEINPIKYKISSSAGFVS